MTPFTFALIAVIILAIAIIGLSPSPPYNNALALTEYQKQKIMTATSVDDLSREVYGVALDTVDAILNRYDPGDKEYEDLIDCGYVDKEPYEILQCWSDKGHVVE
jgi:hypothetical protein